MRYLVLATDYDGTLARDGRVDAPTIAALESVRHSGRRIVLVTGRLLEDLAVVFPRLDLFEHVVAENGAVVHRPATHETRTLAEPPPARFVSALRARGLVPLGVGHVIVATWHPYEDVVLDAIRECGLELQVVFNKGAVMVLPAGINKAVGLAAALAEMKLSPHNAVGIGDAENDHAFLAACECRVAVANALPSLKERADWVTAADHGAGVRELVRLLVDEDLRGVATTAERTALPIGARADGVPIVVPAHGPPVLVAGASGSGKSSLATRLIEEIVGQGRQCCIVDPEGDYRELAAATVLGDPERAPSVDEALELLDVPAQSCVLNLLGLPMPDRPAFFDALLPRLQELRARTGRPHWIVADEAHHLFPAAWHASALTRPDELANLLVITVHPESVSSDLLGRVRLALAVGAGAAQTLVQMGAAIGVAPPAADAPLREGQALAWIRDDASSAVVAFTPSPPRAERRRHVRKYAAGELGTDKSFYFRGPADRLNLRARNLRTFTEIASGVDDDTWEHHRRRHDYSRWFRDAIKDDELAAEVEAIENDAGVAPTASRDLVRAAIDRRYTAPA
jgi:hydroxymethylpyrimidine pyrophosphatase-like HAD family hydrolase